MKFVVTDNWSLTHGASDKVRLETDSVEAAVQQMVGHALTNGGTWRFGVVMNDNVEELGAFTPRNIDWRQASGEWILVVKSIAEQLKKS